MHQSLKREATGLAPWCVTEHEFFKAKEVEDNLVLTESALGNEEVAIVFKPREEWPKMFKYLRLYK